MLSTIYYSRAGETRTVQMTSRLVPNMLAAKFKVITAELGEHDDIPSLEDHRFLDELLQQLGIEILDVVPAKPRR